MKRLPTRRARPPLPAPGARAPAQALATLLLAALWLPGATEARPGPVASEEAGPVDAAEARAGGGAREIAGGAGRLAAALERLARSDWQPELLRAADDREKILESVRRFYQTRDHRPFWNRDRGRALDLLAALEQAPEHGLRYDAYDPNGRLAAQVARHRRAAPGADAGPATAVARRELALSTAMLAYAHDLWHGRVPPEALADRHDVHLEREPLDTGALFEQARGEGVAAALASLAPKHPEYERLRAALAALRERGSEPPSPKVPGGGLLQRGDRGAGVHAVIERLRAAGYLVPPPDGAPDSASYTEAVANAVRAFQRSQGLRVDGLVGEETRRILNRGREEKIDLLVANLDRWRWLPRELGARHVLVNIPAYELRLMDRGALAFATPIIVGTDFNPTPIFADRLEYVVFNPYWTVPYSITAEELLPEFREDPLAVFEKRMEVLDAENEEPMDRIRIDWEAIDADDIRLRQLPGPENSLGLVKFIFPNRHAIYLHDTPADSLFERERRAYSHGCIRLERPTAFAVELLAAEPEWGRGRIEAIMGRDSQPTEVSLPRDLPVYITYFTASAMADDGRVRYYHDVYAYDPVLLAALGRAGEPTNEAGSRGRAAAPSEESS